MAKRPAMCGRFISQCLGNSSPPEWYINRWLQENELCNARITFDRDFSYLYVTADPIDEEHDEGK